MTGRPDDESESRRILERVARETTPGGASLIARTARSARDRVTAADVDRADPIEYWGTRIGRTLGLVVAIGLVAWLVYVAMRGG